MPNILMNTQEKRQWILEMINLYGDSENNNIDRDLLLIDDKNVEKLYLYFSTKDKTRRDSLLNLYKEGALKEYLSQRDSLYKAIGDMRNLIMKFEEMRQNKNDEDDAESILNNISE